MWQPDSTTGGALPASAASFHLHACMHTAHKHFVRVAGKHRSQFDQITAQMHHGGTGRGCSPGIRVGVCQGEWHVPHALLLVCACAPHYKPPEQGCSCSGSNALLLAPWPLHGCIESQLETGRSIAHLLRACCELAAAAAAAGAPAGAQAPPVTRLEAWEAVLGRRRAQVVAFCARVQQELLCHLCTAGNGSAAGGAAAYALRICTEQSALMQQPCSTVLHAHVCNARATYGVLL